MGYAWADCNWVHSKATRGLVSDTHVRTYMTTIVMLMYVGVQDGPMMNAYVVEMLPMKSTVLIRESLVRKSDTCHLWFIQFKVTGNINVL